MVESQVFPVHSFIISAFSKYLARTLDTYPYSPGIVVVDRVKPGIMSQILDYMYGNLSILKESQVREFFKAAKYLEIDSLTTCIPQTSGGEQASSSITWGEKDICTNVVGKGAHKCNFGCESFIHCYCQHSKKCEGDKEDRNQLDRLKRVRETCTQSDFNGGLNEEAAQAGKVDKETFTEQSTSNKATQEDSDIVIVDEELNVETQTSSASSSKRYKPSSSGGSDFSMPRRLKKHNLLKESGLQKGEDKLNRKAIVVLENFLTPVLTKEANRRYRLSTLRKRSIRGCQSSARSSNSYWDGTGLMKIGDKGITAQQLDRDAGSRLGETPVEEPSSPLKGTTTHQEQTSSCKQLEQENLPQERSFCSLC